MGVKCHLLGDSRSLYLPRGSYVIPMEVKELFMPHKTLLGNPRGKTHRPVCAVVTLACMLAVVAKAQDQPKRYDLKLTWKAAVEGHKSELSKDESKVTMLKVLNSDGKALAKDKDKTLPQWYVNGQGQTMVVIPAWEPFVMGSPATENDQVDNETQHQRRIGRAFALAAVVEAIQRETVGDEAMGFHFFSFLPISSNLSPSPSPF